MLPALNCKKDKMKRRLAFLTLLGVALLCGTHGQSIDGSEPSKPVAKAAVEPTPSQTVTTIYYNGISPSWRPYGYGCLDCNWTDEERRHNTSTASIYAQLSSWGSLVFETDTPFASDRCETPPELAALAWARCHGASSISSFKFAAFTWILLHFLCGKLHYLTSFGQKMFWRYASAGLGHGALPLLTFASLCLPRLSILDFWAAGSGLDKVSIFVKDTRTRRYSRCAMCCRCCIFQSLLHWLAQPPNF